jgi:hypothetical protein
VVGRLEVLLGDGQRDLEQPRRAGAVVVDAGTGVHAVGVPAEHHRGVLVATRPVRDEVVAGGAARGELLERGRVAGRVEQALDVVEPGQVSRLAVGAVAAVLVRDPLQLGQVGLHVGDRDVRSRLLRDDRGRRLGGAGGGAGGDEPDAQQSGDGGVPARDHGYSQALGGR